MRWGHTYRLDAYTQHYRGVAAIILQQVKAWRDLQYRIQSASINQGGYFHHWNVDDPGFLWYVIGLLRVDKGQCFCCTFEDGLA